MDSKTRPLEVYITTTNIKNVWNEQDYTIEEEIENNQQWGQDFMP
jgi:hypothetical protein